MKSIFILSGLLLGLTLSMFGQDTPGSKESFIGENWTLIQETYGDLNKDSVDDAALIVEFAGDALEGERPRVLIILFKDKTTQLYTLACRAENVILDGQSGGTLGDPFSLMEIKKNVLRIDFEGGSREQWKTTHRYRFQNNFFRVIGATYKIEDMGVTTIYDYNMSTGSIIITTKDSNEKAKNKTANLVHKILPVGLTDFEPDAVWAMLIPGNYAKASTCKLVDAGLGDCFHLEFDCEDFGGAKTYLDEASQKLWESLSQSNSHDEVIVNPAYKGKLFEITYVQKSGLRCEPEGEGPYQLVVGFKLKN